VLSVSRGADGVWAVNEQGRNKAALSYFASKWSALRYAVRAARDKAGSEVRVLDESGQVASAHAYPDADRGARPPAPRAR
jgi:hypothetical protein